MKTTKVIIGGIELNVPDFKKKHKYFDGDVVKKKEGYYVSYNNDWYKIPEKQTMTETIITELKPDSMKTNKDYIPENNRIVTRQEIISQISKIHKVKKIEYSSDIDKSDANVLTVFLDFQEEESIKHEDLVKGEIYSTDGNYRCYPTIFRYGFNILGKYTYINAIDFKTECPIHKATVAERVKLTKAELKNNDYWDGKELIKLKS